MGLRRFVSRLLRNDDPRESSSASAPPTATALITRSFRATVADELTVPRGAVVRAMYKEDDWIYVEATDGRRGFVPAQYCAIRRREDSRRTQPRSSDWNKSNLQRFIDSLPVKKDDGSPFRLSRLGPATMIFPYQAINLGDISLAANERLQVLNSDDPHWLFVEDEHRARGFVPAAFVAWDNGENATKYGDRFVEQSLLVAEDFHPRSSLDLGVKSGDWVTGVYDEEESWLWVCQENREGFVPSRSVVLATNL